jgi:CheY-like chemotaxis protein
MSRGEGTFRAGELGSRGRVAASPGLGLTIPKKLAEMKGGGVVVESAPEKGTQYGGVQQGQPALGSAPAPRTVPARILVVEDNYVNQKVVSAVLGKRGFAIELANDGREALAKLENGEFDLVLMDVQMPLLDGLEATRLIRQNERWKFLPIVAMTAHAMNGDRERCLEAGMTGYISKPVHPSHLLQTIEAYLAVSPASLPVSQPAKRR